LYVGISIRILDIFSLKPLDIEALRKNIEEVAGKVIIVEEHYPEGGLYEAVCGAVPGSIKKIEHLCVRNVPGSAKP
jgi:transketolase